jgi:hypothetical protein
MGLNAVLLFLFIGQSAKPNFAHAADNHRPSDYLMIPCDLQTGTTEAVMVVDTSNGMLGAFAYDDTHKQIENMPSINLNQIFALANVPNK